MLRVLGLCNTPFWSTALEAFLSRRCAHRSDTFGMLQHRTARIKNSCRRPSTTDVVCDHEVEFGKTQSEERALMGSVRTGHERTWTWKTIAIFRTVCLPPNDTGQSLLFPGHCCGLQLQRGKLRPFCGAFRGQRSQQLWHEILRLVQ